MRIFPTHYPQFQVLSPRQSVNCTIMIFCSGLFSFQQLHSFSFLPDEELLVNVRELGPEVKEGDVIEIYHPEDDLPRLLLQIPHSLDDVSVQKGEYGIIWWINVHGYSSEWTSVGTVVYVGK